jgi:hypothetical protein
VTAVDAATTPAPAHPSFPRAVGLVFQAAVRHWRTCLAISSVYALLSGFTNAVSRSSTGIVDPTTLGASDVAAAGVQALIAMGVLLLVNIFVGPVTLGAMSLVGSADVYDDKVETAGIIRRALDRSLDAVATWLLTTLLLGVPLVALALVSTVLLIAAPIVGFALLLFGSIVLGFPLLYAFVRLSLAIPVVMREGGGPIDALRRSWALTKGAWWWVFGVAVVMSLCIGVVIFFMSLQSFAGQDTVGDFLLGVVTTTLASGVIITLYGLAAGVLYACRAPEDTVPRDVVEAEARVDAFHLPAFAEEEPPSQ